MKLECPLDAMCKYSATQDSWGKVTAAKELPGDLSNDAQRKAALILAQGRSIRASTNPAVLHRVGAAHAHPDNNNNDDDDDEDEDEENMHGYVSLNQGAARRGSVAVGTSQAMGQAGAESYGTI